MQALFDKLRVTRIEMNCQPDPVEGDTDINAFALRRITFRHLSRS